MLKSKEKNILINIFTITSLFLGNFDFTRVHYQIIQILLVVEYLTKLDRILPSSTLAGQKWLAANSYCRAM